MTKTELRAFLAAAVPAAIADGKAYVVRRPGGRAIRELPNEVADAIPQFKRPAPRRMYQRIGTKGAGYEIETYHPFQKT
jgi:hypothetical protein